jgi:signal transduction histidine kinase
MENHFTKTDLNYLIHTILQQLEESIDHRNIKIQLDTLPAIQAVPFQIEQLFTNLLSNAIKFSDPSKSSKIQIRYQHLPAGADRSEGLNETWSYHKIEVEDNGIGFDNDYRDRIFQVFQRLHGKDIFPGTGIGLAICKKIIDNHQGVISASGKTGEGALFTIFIPDFSPEALSRT